MTENSPASLLLGRSKIRQRILALIMDAPERRMHLRAIARAVETSAGTAARELDRLENAGLLRRVREGNQVYFEARPNQPLYGAIRDIVRQTVGAPAVVCRHLSGLSGVERAVIFGSYAHGPLKPDSDVDLLIIGTPDRNDLTERLEIAGLEIGRPVNEVVMTRDELDALRTRGDAFVRSLDLGPTITVIGAEPTPLPRHGSADPVGLAVARRMGAGLRRIHGDHLRGVYLYGSRARGDHRPDSDVDILIVLDRLDAYGAELRRSSELASEISLEYGVMTSRMLASESDWLTGAKPFLVAARRDAVAA